MLRPEKRKPPLVSRSLGWKRATGFGAQGKGRPDLDSLCFSTSAPQIATQRTKTQRHFRP